MPNRVNLTKEFKKEEVNLTKTYSYTYTHFFHLSPSQ